MHSSIFDKAGVAEAESELIGCRHSGSGIDGIDNARYRFSIRPSQRDYLTL